MWLSYLPQLTCFTGMDWTQLWLAVQTLSIDDGAWRACKTIRAGNSTELERGAWDLADPNARRSELCEETVFVLDVELKGLE
jgi:hypothetical protein